MNNYNERLDEILDIHDNLVLLRQAAGDNGDELRDTTKQAIASLTKELVEEAKPKDYTPEGHHPDACLNHEKHTSSCCGCQKQRARLYALGEYQYNLLKALGEV